MGMKKRSNRERMAEKRSAFRQSTFLVRTAHPTFSRILLLQPGPTVSYDDLALHGRCCSGISGLARSSNLTYIDDTQCERLGGDAEPAVGAYAIVCRGQGTERW